ncbi:VTT domain-containing protein [Idiomarina sp. HP20-50]|uniref:TVP38/TMEM64 family protein n=1 Tax=Idiomarina sp. HP20-50 TaxID=3070813 RepID=UPI00294B8426|nr:VTT domain-containing protein [Idiomarina sp. HP20-50]MDV6316865.1 VTT domain-containing protein [Idiomarina sp. HP20-50]
MSGLIKIVLLFGLIFASTFILANMAGVLSLEKINNFFITMNRSSPEWIALILILILFADLFVAIPTLSVILLGGFFLGPVTASLSAITGLLFAGVVGYVLNRSYGSYLFKWLIKSQTQRNEAISAFNKHGYYIILLSRAVPILPEVSACLSGLTKLPFWKFITCWLISIVPYSVIASYAGSISTVQDPSPAIITAISFTAFFGVAWFLLKKYKIDSAFRTIETKK